LCEILLSNIFVLHHYRNRFKADMHGGLIFLLPNVGKYFSTIYANFLDLASINTAGPWPRGISGKHVACEAHVKKSIKYLVEFDGGRKAELLSMPGKNYFISYLKIPLCLSYQEEFVTFVWMVRAIIVCSANVWVHSLRAIVGAFTCVNLAKSLASRDKIEFYWNWRTP